MATILAIHSEEDPLIQQLSKDWLQIVTNSAIAPYTLYPLLGSAASRRWNPAFSQIVSDPSIALVTGLAHGGPGTFTGFQGETLYGSGPGWSASLAEVSGKVVHLLSCSTAQNLSAAFVAAGCVAYIGYSDVVPIEQSTEAWTKTLVQCDSTIELSLAKGLSVSTAVQDAKLQMQLYGLGNIGALLTCTPSGSSAVLPSTSNAIVPAVVTPNQINARSLPPPNVLPVWGP